MAFHGYSSQEEFERQLNPSRWSKRLDSDAVIKEHMTQTKNGTRPMFCVWAGKSDDTRKQQKRSGLRETTCSMRNA